MDAQGAGERRLRIGILGAGAITQFAHLPAMARCKRAELAALCDGAEDLLHRVADKAHVGKRYTNYDQMLGDGDIDAVIIAAPDPFHVPLASRALRAGKHVLVEKPMGETSGQCRELMAVVKETGLKLQIGSMKRHDPGMAFAAAFLRQSAGRILSASGLFRDTIFRPAMQESCLDPLLTSDRIVRPAKDPKADRAHYNLTTHGAHLFDSLRYLAGDISAVTAHMAQHAGNWTWHGILEFAGGGAGHFELTTKSCGDWCERYEICGETGSARVEVSLPFHHVPAEVSCFDGKTRTTTGNLGEFSNGYANQVDAFARSIFEDLPTNPGVRDGLAAVMLLEAVEESVRTGGRVAIAPIEEGG